MKTMMRNPHRGIRTFGLFLASAIALAGVASAVQAPLGGASPEELAQRYNAAEAKGDLAELAACLAPAPRRVVAFSLVMGASMMAAMSALGAEAAKGDGKPEGAGGKKGAKDTQAVDAILAKHHFKMEADPAAEGLGEAKSPEEMDQRLEKAFAGVDTIAHHGSAGVPRRALGREEEGRREAV